MKTLLFFSLLINGIMGVVGGYLLHKHYEQHQIIIVLQEEIDTLQGE